ncbi:MFS transporter [Novosphingobium sp.]|uniref:MFS transporter n=1 Tax=Novosphingobium sp. TaxID=1874826 RepID=UPI001D4EAE5B|nr:MFS transporter [Novosphingobium sp.]MBX9663276.1 MFS transporter [Novosphingobium sp.]
MKVWLRKRFRGSSRCPKQKPLLFRGGVGGGGFRQTAAALALVVCYLSLATIPVMARVLGLFPAKTSALLLPILLGSMLSDVVEEDGARTGRRSEGVFFAGSFDVLNCAGGMGIFLTGMLITDVGFPTGAQPGNMPMAVLDHLALAYSGNTLVLGSAGALILWHYPISPSGNSGVR